LAAIFTMAKQLAILALELSHFIILSVILQQYSAIFTILLSYFVFCYNELSHFCDSISHFSLLQYSSIFPYYRAYPLCYSAQTFYYSARLFYDFVSHLPLLQYSAIFDCYNTQPLFSPTVLSHFVTVLSHL
jgi:hypothetical protein